MNKEENKQGAYVVITDKFHCQNLVLNDKAIWVSKEDLEAIEKTKCFDVENNCVIDYDNTEDLEKERIEKLRRLREPLLVAFDKYKTNVVYGLVIETPEEKELIINWYKSILDLNEAALNDVPEKIKYFL